MLKLDSCFWFHLFGRSVIFVFSLCLGSLRLVNSVHVIGCHLTSDFGLASYGGGAPSKLKRVRSSSGWGWGAEARSWRPNSTARRITTLRWVGRSYCLGKFKGRPPRRPELAGTEDVYPEWNFDAYPTIELYPGCFAKRNKTHYAYSQEDYWVRCAPGDSRNTHYA